jgi:hypothetical protein
MPGEKPSNDPNDKPYIVQAFNTEMGWVDSNWQADTLPEAREQASALIRDDRAWVNPEQTMRPVRIVHDHGEGANRTRTIIG